MKKLLVGLTMLASLNAMAFNGDAFRQAITTEDASLISVDQPVITVEMKKQRLVEITRYVEGLASGSEIQVIDKFNSTREELLSFSTDIELGSSVSYIAKELYNELILAWNNYDGRLNTKKMLIK